ncbi:MAG: type IV pilus secretin PilQ family protein [Cellvibrionaceae bacterium]|nr:type IV pilus secretin PilQ family protein [Cellvibrionaceae bacterium]
MRMNLLRSFALFVALAATHIANGSTLTAINFAELPGERAEIRLSFDSLPSEPEGYTIEQPARIVLDFAKVENTLAQKRYSMAVGEVASTVVVSGGGRTRLIINLNRLVAFESRAEDDEYVIEIGSESASLAAVARTPGRQAAPRDTTQDSNRQQQGDSALSQSWGAGPGIADLDFRRGEVGEGKIIITLSDPRVNIDVSEVSGGIVARFLKTGVDARLLRKLDVVDFATPVTTLGVKQEGDNVLVSVSAKGDYDYLAYQAENQYVISVKPLTRDQVEEKKREFEFTGDRLSLNFQDIQVRSVLQLIADFTQLNLVASDTVTGSITLRLENVPWDQALDIVLKTKGLDKRQIGNVLMVAPAAEIAERERQEIETKKQLQELAPLRTEYIRIRYANARELFNLFMEAGGGGGQGGGIGGQGQGQGQKSSTGSILSDRGQAIVDERTNSIILTDTAEKIQEFRVLVDRIDIPVRQVMIEARIVIANNDFRKELGVRIAGDAVDSSDSHKYEFTGRLDGLVNADGAGPEAVFIDSDGDGITDDERNLAASNLVDLGVFNPAGAFTWNVISSNFLLGMELSALQESGYAEIVSQPKVITGDKQQATIESGSEIPFQEESASGGTTTSFKDAVLKLDVTPQITPDNRVIMDLVINQDSVSSIDLASGIPTLDITQLETQVLVADGETVVLGGIYQVEKVSGQTKVPLLGDIPILGRLFRNEVNREGKRELLIFITPKIMASDIIRQ